MSVRYDADRGQLVVQVQSTMVERRLPVRTWEQVDEFIKTRRVIVEFENRWQLSILWGGTTYSTNHDYIVWTHVAPPGVELGSESQPFVEAPNTVEVGVLVPEPITKPSPMTPETVTALRELDPDLPHIPSSMLAPYDTHLWGDPLPYVDSVELLVLVNVVARLPSHPDPALLTDPGFDDVDTFLAIVHERFGIA